MQKIGQKLSVSFFEKLGKFSIFGHLGRAECVGHTLRSWLREAAKL